MGDFNQERIFKMSQTYSEIEGVEVNNVKDFPYSGIKVVGGIQMGLGLICIVLGLTDDVLIIFQDDDAAGTSGTTPPPQLQEVLDMLRTLTLTSAPIWCGLWYIVTGAISICMSENRKSSLYYIKITFLVLSILCATVFGPICLGISGFVTTLRHTLAPEELRWLIPLLAAFFSLNEVVFAIVSASICCCCSPVRTSKVRLLVTRPNDEKYNPRKEYTVNSPDIDMFTTTDRHGRSLPIPRPSTQDSNNTFIALKRLALPSKNDRSF